ncbi:hypothetical protein C5167_041006, partial [Papaver somniferum]
TYLERGFQKNRLRLHRKTIRLRRVKSRATWQNYGPLKKFFEGFNLGDPKYVKQKKCGQQQDQHNDISSQILSELNPSVSSWPPWLSCSPSGRGGKLLAA